jgi:hypothetical protein
MNPVYSASSEVMLAAGYVTFTSTITAANTLIQSAGYAPTAGANGAVLGQAMTMGPDSRVPVVAWPTTGYAPQVAGGGAANIVMLDLRAYAADIINVDANFVMAAGAGTITGGAAGQFICAGVDNVNKFAYFQALSLSGAALTLGPGMAMQWQVLFKDTYAV